MIRKIHFSNFYSFEEKQEISFLAKKKNSYSYESTTSKDYVTKIATFIGANASGKTNIMRFFSFISYFVCMSSKNESAPQNDIAFKTFYNNNKPSSFYIEYEDENKIYFYNLVIKNNTILKEEFSLKQKIKNAKKQKLFLRKYDHLDYLNGKFFQDFPKKFIKNIRPDVSLIAFLKSHYNVEIINNIFSYFFKFQTNINEHGEINNYVHQIKTLKLYLSDTILKKNMETFIKSFDLGLEGFIIKKDKNTIFVTGIHSAKENNNKLAFKYESRGTQSLFFTLANIFTAIKNNTIVVIDEIESGLHPEALNKLISYLIDENKNNRAQIIFSSHSLTFINKLDMHQIFLTEKNTNGQSNVYRLNEVEGIRSDENFLTKYMSGAYGGFPNIRI